MGHQPGVLTVDGARTPRGRDPGQPLQGHDVAGVGDHRHLSQFVESLADVALVADLDRVALAALDGRRHVQAAQSGGDDLVDHHRGHAVAGRFLAVDLELVIGLAHDDVGVYRAGIDVVMRFQLLGDGQRGLGQSFQVIAVNPHRHRGFNAALQHNDATLDRLQRRSRRNAWQRGDAIDFVPYLSFRHPFAPLISRLQHHVRFDHRSRRGIEC